MLEHYYFPFNLIVTKSGAHDEMTMERWFDDFTALFDDWADAHSLSIFAKFRRRREKPM